jgi:uncharacterized protein (TIGR02421 family)
MSPPKKTAPAKVPSPSEDLSWIIAQVEEHLEEKRRLKMALPEGGRLYLERRLPFLAVYRRPGGRPDPGTGELVTSQAAFLIAGPSDKGRHPIAAVVREICERCQPAFGAFLVIEIWSRPEAHPPVAAPSVPPTPAFRLFGVSKNSRAMAVVEVLERHLKTISVGGQKAVTELVKNPLDFPAKPRPFLSAAEARRLKCIQIGIEIEPVYQQDAGGVYPGLLKRLRRKIGYTLQHGFFHFAEHQTELRPKDFHALGQRALVKTVWTVDSALAAISSEFDFLMEIAPVNADAVWSGFRKSGFEKLPPFRYRPLSIDPGLEKRALYAIPIERIEDPTISHLFFQKQAELDRTLTMLADRDTSRFLLGSQQVYGKVSAALTRTAETILERIPPFMREKEGGRKLGPKAMAELARKELARYTKKWPEATAKVEFRENLIAGLMVSKGRLLISTTTGVRADAADALIQHEVGTHLVTYFNGGAQRFAQLRSGLAGYEQLQEGLAVLAEYLVGGLTPGRMRTLAARVVAARSIIDGATFIDCFRLLSRYGFSRRAAFTITLRIYRGGGLTKDCIYLRGLNEVLRYLRDGGDLELLFVGKISTRQIPIISELQSRGVIAPPKLMPHYLERKSSQERLAELRQGVAVHDLLETDAE